MSGVFVAAYARPTRPLASSSTGYFMPYSAATLRFMSASLPCLPAAAELTASHTTPFAIAREGASLSDPTVWAFFTKGQPGLNHSRTTVLPLKLESVTACPSRSVSVKSGAGEPTAALAIEALESSAGAAAAEGEGAEAGAEVLDGLEDEWLHAVAASARTIREYLIAPTLAD